jgi:regulatory protein
MDQTEQDQVHQALNRAFFYLKFRPRSEKEVRDYLQKKAVRFRWPEAVIETAVASLKEQNYINDDEFVEWFVHQRSTGKPKSAFALSHELQRFGIHKDNVTQFFDTNPVDEEELAFNALQRRWLRYKDLDKKVRFQKAAAFLSRRGFQFDVIKKSIDRIQNDDS